MSQAVINFYNTNADAECGRLEQPLCRIEFASTWRLIQKHFPASGRVCDIGSGAGRYAVELAQRGYRVTLLDISERLLERARLAFERNQVQAERFVCTNARDLNVLETEGFDAALVLGPMYHLIEPQDRARVLRELRRALKPGGVAVVAYLNSWGILRTGVADFPERYRDAAFVRSMLGELRFEGELHGFTECYWATPPSALSELRDADFEIVTYAGAEGFAGGLRPLIEKLAAEDAEAYQNLVSVAAETSELPQYRDACDHLHFVVRKRTD